MPSKRWRLTDVIAGSVVLIAEFGYAWNTYAPVSQSTTAQFGGDALRYGSTRVQPPDLTQLSDEVADIL